MAQTSISEGVLRELGAGMRGAVLLPGDDGYDAARTVFNAMIDRRPAVIAQPADTADVQRAVRFAREHDLLVSIKGGGHSPQGDAVCEGGLMIDLVALKSVAVDPQARTALAGGGVNWGEFDAATQEHGLAIPGGRMPTTGIAGLTPGRGPGRRGRRCGAYHRAPGAVRAGAGAGTAGDGDRRLLHGQAGGGRAGDQAATGHGPRAPHGRADALR